MLKRAVVTVAVLAVLLAACGDDDGGGDGEAATTAGGGSPPVSLEGEVNDHGTSALEQGDSVELEMEADDFYFGPTFVTGQPGQTVTVELENEGDSQHTFTIDSLDIDEELAPGDSAEVEVTLPDSGSLDFYCRFHRAQGMQGAFSVG